MQIFYLSINKIYAKIEYYCDESYNNQMYLNAYSYVISPLLDLAILKEIELLPPKLKRLPIRPRANRKRQEDEGPISNLAQKIATLKCNNCK